jgi:hypothetical protein
MAVDQDAECVAGSMARAEGSWEIWVKPLADGTFASVLLNKGEAATNVTLHIGASGDDAFDFVRGKSSSVSRRTEPTTISMLTRSLPLQFPAMFENYTVRNLLDRVDLGKHEGDYTVAVRTRIAQLVPFVLIVGYHRYLIRRLCPRCHHTMRSC